MTVVPRPSTVSAVSTASSSRNDTESAVWPGVAITVMRSPAASMTSPSLSGPPRPRRKPLPTERTTAPGALDDLVDAPGVVLMLVADQHQRDRAEFGDLGDVLVVIGSRVDDHHLVAAGPAQHPGVGAVERHQPRVVAQQHRRGLGDRAQQPVGGMLERHFTSAGSSLTRPRR